MESHQKFTETVMICVRKFGHGKKRGAEAVFQDGVQPSQSNLEQYAKKGRRNGRNLTPTNELELEARKKQACTRPCMKNHMKIFCSAESRRGSERGWGWNVTRDSESEEEGRTWAKHVQMPRRSLCVQSAQDVRVINKVTSFLADVNRH